jgi:hypothetical protein
MEIEQVSIRHTLSDQSLSRDALSIDIPVLRATISQRAIGQMGIRC